MKAKLFLFFLIISTILPAQTDTINRIDNNGLKQAYWIVKFDKSKQTYKEGKYLDNNKEGIWKEYLINGILISEITYSRNEPSGYAKIYYTNGQLAEEGVWENDCWTGKYIAYYKNGNVNYKWQFTKEGLRTGKQQYFYENGKQMISGNWENGKESGVISRYNEKGKLIEQQTFNNGSLNPELTLKFSSEKKERPNIEVKKNTIAKDTTKQKTIERFNTTGPARLYDKHKRLWKEGDFDDGKLMKGKIYYYKNDTIYKTVIIKNGEIFNTIKN